ncbi:MAG: hypothetical protein FWD78_11630 [Treponema sp.]|nr:hypothetical protein [Treponema sp.]
MFGVGFSEIIVIIIVMMIFIKPDDVPKFIRKAGKMYGKAKKLYNELMMVKDKILKEIDEVATLEDKTPEQEKSGSLTTNQTNQHEQNADSNSSHGIEPKVGTADTGVTEKDSGNSTTNQHEKNADSNSSHGGTGFTRDTEKEIEKVFENFSAYRTATDTDSHGAAAEKEKNEKLEIKN